MGTLFDPGAVLHRSPHVGLNTPRSRFQRHIPHLVSRRFEYAGLKTPEAHSRIAGLRLPAESLDVDQAVARILRRKGKHRFGSIEPDLHVGMLEQRQQSAPRIALPRL